MKKYEQTLLHEMTLKGFPKIERVYAKRYTEHSFHEETGK